MTTGDDVDGVLDSIDGALQDWSTSPDAMRWTPEPARPSPKVSVSSGSVRFIRSLENPAAPTIRELEDGEEVGTVWPTSPAARLADDLGITMSPWQQAWIDRVYQDVERRFWHTSLAVPRQHWTTVMYAFHDEDGHLVVTADPDAAAAAPGPISIGFDGSA